MDQGLAEPVEGEPIPDEETGKDPDGPQATGADDVKVPGPDAQPVDEEEG